ncbi:MAG: hypothetical protein K1X33_09465 [Methanobacteriaceae archaeon]|nr:hypothetical protein [Methanobacteriaceae archaeon]
MRVTMICFVKSPIYKKYSIFLDSCEFDSIEIRNYEKVDINSKLEKLIKRVELNKNFEVAQIKSPKIKEDEETEYIDWDEVCEKKKYIFI